jgi:defect-in-organelle-trafficking protein DotC
MSRSNAFLRFLLAGAVLAIPTLARADDASTPKEPPSLEWLQDYSSSKAPDSSDNDIRRAGLQDAALSFGIRGGLSHRTWELSKIVGQYERQLDASFDFHALQMAAPGGLLVDLPVVTEGQGAVEFKAGRQIAAVSDRNLVLQENVHLTDSTRSWSDYISLAWNETIDPPDPLLLPKDADERERFRQWVAQGWKIGIEQANDIFYESVDRLVRDFVGKVRYRELLAQRMVSAPYVDMTDRGVTGGGNKLQIGDRQISITGAPALDNHPDRWTPALQ